MSVFDRLDLSHDKRILGKYLSQIFGYQIFGFFDNIEKSKYSNAILPKYLGTRNQIFGSNIFSGHFRNA